MSRSGCSQIDDSHSLVLDENGWTQVRTGDGVDIYVFAYGNDYKEALNDFYRLTGKTPMLQDMPLELVEPLLRLHRRQLQGACNPL